MSLNLPDLTADVNAHQNLPDQPTLSANELKQAWDQPASDIKTYINSLLIPQIESQVTSEITNGVNTAKAYTDSAVGGINLDADNIDYDNTSSGLTADNVQDAIDELNTSVSSATSTANEKIKYSDFDVSTGTISGTLSPGAFKSGTLALSKAGYYPLGIVGEQNSQEEIDVRRNQITERQSGTGVLSYTIHNEDYGNNRPYTIKFDILWVKVS